MFLRRACAIMPGDRSTPSIQSTTGRNAAPESRCRSRDRAWCRNAPAGSAARQTSATAANQHLRRGIGQRRQRVVEFRRILVEHRAHIVGGHGVAADIEQPQPQVRRPAGRTDRRSSACSNAVDRAVALARLLPRIAEIEPARGEAGRELHRLLAAGRSQPRTSPRSRYSRAIS